MSVDIPGIEDPDHEVAPVPTRTGSRTRAALVLLLGLLLLVSLVSAGYLLHRRADPTDQPFAPFSGASTAVSDRQRHEVQAVAEQFSLRMDNIDGPDFDAYVKKIEQLLTTKAKTDNKSAFSTMAQTYKSAKITGTGKILLSGVGDIDPDSATVLVAHDATVKAPQGSLVHHYRWSVDLVKVGGKWLVDSFTPVS